MLKQNRSYWRTERTKMMLMIIREEDDDSTAEQSFPRVPCSNTREVGRRLLGFGIHSVAAHALADLLFGDPVHLQNYPSRPTNIPLARIYSQPGWTFHQPYHFAHIGLQHVRLGRLATHGFLKTPFHVCVYLNWTCLWDTVELELTNV